MDEKTRGKKIVATSIVGIAGNLLLVAAKAFIGILTGSASIVSDAINNLSDALSSGVTIVGTKLSQKKPNRKHPFGYGRIEYLTATVVAAIILFAGGSAIYESIVSLVNGDKPTYDWVAFLILGLSIAAKLALGLYFRIRGKALHSQALRNSGTDALFDSLLTAATLASALISHFTQVYLEGYAGILIGLFILRSGFIAMKEAISPILGDRIDDELAREIKAAVCAHPDVRGAYDLIVNSYGEGKSIGSIHVEVSDSLPAKDVYSLEREIQEFTYRDYGIIMTVGVYASNDTIGGLGKEIRDKVFALTREDHDVIQTHGFYFNEEKKTVIFDVVVNFETKRSDEEVASSLVSTLEKDFPDISFYPNVDHDIAG